MKRFHPFLIFIGLFILFPAAAHSQAWSGIIDPKRAVDWSGAGIPGGVPSASWTQCGATLPSSSTASQINTAITACGANQFVLLGPGTFNLAGAIKISGKNNVAVRGSGANSTFLVFSSSSGSGCNTGQSQVIGMCGPDAFYPAQPPPNIVDWSAGYAQGTNQITLSSTAGLNLNTSANPTLLFLNQNDTGFSGYNPSSGTATDNGNYFVCAPTYNTTGPVGCSANGPNGSIGTTLNNRWQYEMVTITAINGNVVTISPPLKHPNWTSGQSPKAWSSRMMRGSGIENVSIDLGTGASSVAIGMWGCYQCWVSGVKIINIQNFGLEIQESSHSIIQNSYFANSTGADPYGILMGGLSADCLYVNNIFQGVRSPIVFNGVDEGTVVAYNFSIYDKNSGSTFGSVWAHAAGDDFHLFEGNIGTGLVLDNLHGSHMNETAFRNFYTGWESCAINCPGANHDFGATALAYEFDTRYGQSIANVAGTPGYHNTYQGGAFGCGKFIYCLGMGNPAVGGGMPTDPLAASTLLRWGNWDSVTNAVRWCGNSSNTGWSTTCASTSEVPTDAPLYPNAVPTVGDTSAGQPALPASFYYSSMPAWWPSGIPWPPIGPDVSNGSVGQCAGALNVAGKFNGVAALNASQCAGSGLNTAWGGHVNGIPAMVCYLNVMNGPPDGSGPVLAFDANTCYGAVAPRPNPPTKVSAVVN